jgi:SAM-dependent methyltransferase
LAPFTCGRQNIVLLNRGRCKTAALPHLRNKWTGEHVMGLYSRVLFPRGLDWLMSRPPFPDIRQALLAQVGGKVLEVGFGTGLNLPHYPSHIHELTTVDPNPGMNSVAQRRIKASPIVVRSHMLHGEQLPMADESFDTVVSTWTLCSIENVERALRELRRVLKPDGRYVFIEHGLSDDPKVQRWQHLLTPLQKIYADGCHLNRNMREIIQQQGFSIVELEQFYLDRAPKSQGYMYRGVATK